jgi:hypothetical protein
MASRTSPRHTLRQSRCAAVQLMLPGVGRHPELAVVQRETGVCDAVSDTPHD